MTVWHIKRLLKEIKAKIREAFEILKESVKNNDLMSEDALSKDGYASKIKECYENFEKSLNFLTQVKQ